jgi:hypothetical protein
MSITFEEILAKNVPVEEKLFMAAKTYPMEVHEAYDIAFSKTSADMERYINDAPAYLGFLSHIKKNASKLSPEDLQFVKGLDDELTRVGALLKAYSEKSTGLMTVMSSLLK